MKVALESVEVSDEQLVQIANVTDGKVSKRRATRKQARDYVWGKGEMWETHLVDDYAELTGETAEADEDEDLLGVEDDNEDIDLEDLL